jgi:hypothetical protein
VFATREDIHAMKPVINLEGQIQRLEVTLVVYSGHNVSLWDRVARIEFLIRQYADINNLYRETTKPVAWEG